MKPVVTGMGWVHGGGAGRGRAGGGSAPGGWCWVAGRLPRLRGGEIFPTPYKDFGRMDSYSRLGLAAVALALKDGGIDAWTAKRPVGLVVATAYGCLHTDIAYCRTAGPRPGSQASPTLFTYTLPSCFLADAAILFGLTGPAFVVQEAGGAGGLASLEMALESLCAAEAGQILWGVCDLGRPALLPGPEDAPAGALFFLLEAHAPAHRPDYGGIALDVPRGVRFRGRRVETPAGLARACLAQAEGEGGGAEGA